MDVVLKNADDYLFDSLYNSVLPTMVFDNHTSLLASDLAITPWTHDNPYRQSLTLFLILCFGGWIFYLVSAWLSYTFSFDHEVMKHPKFLKNQVRQEIVCAMSAVPGLAILTVPWFVGEIKGYSMLYEGTPQTLYEWCYLIGTIPFFLFITDMGIYWIHRLLHHPLIYKSLHKLHHKWIVPTPFASIAFHPVDGYLQSTPYHIYAFLIPMHKWLYLTMFILVNVWTVLIHDGNYFSHSDIINTTAHHTVHHLYFNYNYGQYFTFWDKLGGSHRKPTAEQYDAALRNNKNVWAAQSKDADTIELEDENKALKYKTR